MSDETFTEQEAFSDIFTWSEKQPVWQKNALCRLMKNNELGDSDIEQLILICKNRNCDHEQLLHAHDPCQDTNNDDKKISLLSISKTEGINALAKEQTLDFSPNGLTIIYGDNASGKSGYVRILKNACKTRDRDFIILRDIQDTNNTKQVATISYMKGKSKADDFLWNPNNPPNSDLTSINIFDSNSASVHVEEENSIAYMPRPMKLLRDLAYACDRLQEKIITGLWTKISSI